MAQKIAAINAAPAPAMVDVAHCDKMIALAVRTIDNNPSRAAVENALSRILKWSKIKHDLMV